jgi:undecaprenyl-diphosphatase
MNTVQALILGVVQGFTEFLPVSSSGHLKLAEHYMGFTGSTTMFDLYLHLATLIAVLTYFYKPVFQVLRGLAWPILRTEESWKGLRLAGLILLSAIPSGVLGVLYGHRLESLADSVTFVGINMVINGVILLSTLLIRRAPWSRLNWKTALIIGFAQCLGILRGISRSGSTITAGMHAGLDPEEAGTFSFLLFVPTVTGAFLLELLKSHGAASVPGLSLATGFVAALITGWVALKFLMLMLKKRIFYVFGLYTLALGLMVIVVGG